MCVYFINPLTLQNDSFVNLGFGALWTICQPGQPGLSTLLLNFEGSSFLIFR